MLRNPIARFPSLIAHWRAPTLLSKQIAWLHWCVPLAAFLIVLVHQIIEDLWFTDATQLHFVADTFFYGLPSAGSITALRAKKKPKPN